MCKYSKILPRHVEEDFYKFLDSAEDKTSAVREYRDTLRLESHDLKMRIQELEASIKSLRRNIKEHRINSSLGLLDTSSLKKYETDLYFAEQELNKASRVFEKEKADIKEFDNFIIKCASAYVVMNLSK